MMHCIRKKSCVPNEKSYKKCLAKNEGTITGFMPNGSKVANIIIVFQYFRSSFKTRGALIMITLLLYPILEQRACF